eukprot:850158-Prymnesium_polylepis.1
MAPSENHADFALVRAREAVRHLAVCWAATHMVATSHAQPELSRTLWTSCWLSDDLKARQDAAQRASDELHCTTGSTAFPTHPPPDRQCNAAEIVLQNNNLPTVGKSHVWVVVLAM